MPMRNYSFQAPDDNLGLVSLRDLHQTEGNVFEDAFNVDIETEEWNDWIRCEGNNGNNSMPQLETSMLDRRESEDSTISWLEDSTSANNNVERKSVDVEEETLFPSSFFNSDEYFFEDALSEPMPPCYGFPIEASTVQASKNAIQSLQEAPRNFRGYSSLTEEEERSLTNIAMPYHILAQINTRLSVTKPKSSSSPTASYSSPTLSPSPEPPTRTRKARTKKRKASVSAKDSNNDAESRTALCQSRKTGHNAIEKRYRTNLNQKIDCLRQGVPSFSRSGSSELKSGEGDEDEDEDKDHEEGRNGQQQKYGKAAILTRALEYIKHLESSTERLGSEVGVLKSRVGAFEKLAMSGSFVIGEGGGLAPNGGLAMMSEGGS